MKCPKCGYHSFDYLNSCKKCDNDLTAFKSKYKLRSLVFPQRPLATKAEVEASSTTAMGPGLTAGTTVAAATDFGFDFMDGDGKAQPTEPESPDFAVALPAADTADDTFSWDDNAEPEPAEATATAGASEDFDWDEDAPEEPLAVEDSPAEESSNDDTFGLDLSWDSELPVTEDEEADGEDDFEPITADGLPEWDFDEDAPQKEIAKEKAKGTEEGPNDPFDLRGPGTATPVPAFNEAEAPLQEDTRCEPSVETTPGATISGTSLAKAIAALGPTEEAMLDDQSEDLPKSLQISSPSIGSRILALGVDLLVLAVAIVLFLIAGEMALAPAGSQRLFPSLDTLLTLAIPYFLIIFSSGFGYFTLFHFLTGQTPGKMLLKLRVETDNGGSLTFAQAFLRSTGGLFSLLLFGIGYLAGLFDLRRRGWNDRLAGTLVVFAATDTGTGDEMEID